MKPIFFVIWFFLVYAATCQTVAAPSKDEKEAIYLSTPFPFLMEGISHSIALPESFQIDKKGKAVVYLFIDDQGNKEGFSIVLLDLGKEDVKKFYEFAKAPKRQAMYPPNIQPFYPILKKEIAKIKIKKKKDTQILKGQKYYYAIVYSLE